MLSYSSPGFGFLAATIGQKHLFAFSSSISIPVSYWSVKYEY